MAAEKWSRNFMKSAIFIWKVALAVSVAILLLSITGVLNIALPEQSQRNAWVDVNNQIMTVLFTVMSLYLHPQRLNHLVLLFRWNTDDIPELRKIYCKNGTYKPHERAHMLVVILLLNLNCFAQYAFCGVLVGYKQSDRPAVGLLITGSVVLGSAAIAGIYTAVSPLGKKYDFAVDEEAQALRHPLM